MNTLDIKNNASHVYAHRWWSFTVLSFSLLVISLDNTVLNVALPTLARDLAASPVNSNGSSMPTRSHSLACCSPLAA